MAIHVVHSVSDEVSHATNRISRHVCLKDESIERSSSPVVRYPPSSPFDSSCSLAREGRDGPGISVPSSGSPPSVPAEPQVSGAEAESQSTTHSSYTGPLVHSLIRGDAVRAMHSDPRAYQDTRINSQSPHIPQLLPALSTLSPDLKSLPNGLLLWQYFVETSSHVFKCWGSEETNSTFVHLQDPLTTVLPTMAAFNPILRPAALAFSAHCLSLASPAGASTSHPRQLYIDAIEALTSSRYNISLTLDTILPSLAACLLLYRIDANPRSHLILLARSAAACARTTDIERCRRDVRYRALMALLSWMEICTFSSLHQFSLPVADAGSLPALTYGLEDEPDTFDGFKDWLTHPIFAFSHRLVNPLWRIAELSRARRNHVAWTCDMEAAVAALEEDLLVAYDHDTEAAMGNPQDPKPLLHVNEAMYSASFIMFYTRLGGLPFTSPLIRKQVDKIVRESSCVDMSSLPGRAFVFPLFVAGCEAVEWKSRELIADKLVSCGAHDGSELQTIAAQLRRIWKLRDNEPGLNWLDWTQKSEYWRFHHSSSLTCFSCRVYAAIHCVLTAKFSTCELPFLSSNSIACL